MDHPERRRDVYGHTQANTEGGTMISHWCRQEPKHTTKRLHATGATMHEVVVAVHQL